MKQVIKWISIVMVFLLPLGTLADINPSYEYPVEEIDAYFADALFVGDSITRQLHSYVIKERKEGNRPLGDADFVTAHSYMIYNASRRNLGSNEINLRYKGKEYTFEKLLLQIKPHKVFLLLGLNDGARKNPEKQINYFTRTIDIFQEALPDSTLVIQSLSPVTHRQKASSIQQPNIDAFNEVLQKLCEEKGVVFLDMATPLKGPDGLLPTSLSSDYLVHLNEDGLKIWIHTLRLFAQEQLKAGNP